MKKADRIAAAIAGATWGGFIAWFGMSSVPNLMARDFSWPWRAARALLQGHDPYQVVSATGDYPFNVGLFYPLPAAILALPVAPFLPAIAGAIFVAVSAGLLGWAVSTEGWRRMSLFLSAPFCMAALLGQWSMLLTAAALLPTLQFVCVAKPTIGFATWLHRPSWRGVIRRDGTLRGRPRVPAGVAVQVAGVRAQRDFVSGAGAVADGLLHAARLSSGGAGSEGRVFLGMALVSPAPRVLRPASALARSVDRLALPAALGAELGRLVHVVSRRARCTTQFIVARPLVLSLIYAPALVMLLLLPAREDHRAPKEEAIPSAT